MFYVDCDTNEKELQHFQRTDGWVSSDKTVFVIVFKFFENNIARVPY